LQIKSYQGGRLITMKIKLLLIGSAVLLILLSAAYAADVTGKWVAEMPGRGGQGPTQTTFDLKADGPKLTGTVTSGQGEPAEITEGKVEGDNISFLVVRKRNDMEIKMLYKGKVTGDEIKLTREFQMPPGGPGGGGPPPGAGQGGGQGGPPGGGMGGPPPEIIAKRVK